jgi:hypothetical protein
MRRDPDQEEHDREIARGLKRLAKRTPEKKAESKRKLEALLAEKAAPGPIESAMRNHPGLTREAAERMAHDLGF